MEPAVNLAVHAVPVMSPVTLTIPVDLAMCPVIPVICLVIPMDLATPVDPAMFPVMCLATLTIPVMCLATPVDHVRKSVTQILDAERDLALLFISTHCAILAHQTCLSHQFAMRISWSLEPTNAITCSALKEVSLKN